MAVFPKRISRQNDFYPILDVFDAVNNVGSALNVGDVVLLDWVAVGDNASLISPFTQALATTHMKAVVMVQPNSSGIAAGAIGNVRVQGAVYALSYTGVAYTLGDPIALSLAGSATDNGLITSVTVTAPGTNSTYIPTTLGAALESKASAGTQQLVSVFFDGTQINGIYLKD